MKRLLIAVLLAVAPVLAACPGDDTTPETPVRLRLTRRPQGRIAVEILEAPAQPAALQVELIVDGAATFELDDARAPDGLPLDTVRMAAAGTNRAILFAADKRGILLPRAGDAASFTISSPGSDAALRIASAVVSDADGHPLPVELGPALSVR